ncbi:MAG: phosphoribosylformylglycinamidine synthase subunit PurL [Bdellovibrionales bacterium]
MTSEQLHHQLKTYKLTSDEYERICELLGRPPKGIEWALFSALWSEHCSYKSSKIYLKKLFSKSSRVMQSFGENAGVVDLGLGEKVAFKIESHNHPSFIEPYQGAATGVGGIIRDILTMGARPIALANYLCFGEASKMSHYVDGVVRGIAGYGNCVGVPMVTGQTEFHSSYNKNILVNAMCVGYFGPNDPIVSAQAKGPGNWVVYVGAKTGKDGVHGARMASESFSKKDQDKRPNIQIGDPFFEKLLIESCLEVIGQDLVVCIQDMGAAGLISSSFEMASKGDVGFTMHLDLVPLRNSDLTPEEILVSESQERMLLVCEPSKFEKIREIFSRWNLDAVKIGDVTKEREMKIYWKSELLTKIDPHALVENAPQFQRPFHDPASKIKDDFKPQISARNSLKTDALMEVLQSPQGTSRRWVWEQYDQRVGTQTVRDCSSSVGVIRLPSGRGLGIVLGGRPHMMRLESRLGGFDSVFEPSLQLASLGFEPIAATDCLNYGSPEDPQIMGEFVHSLNGLNDACKSLNIPIISGNVSFYNQTEGQNITSTPSVGIVGLKDDIHIPKQNFATEGASVYVVSLPQVKTTGLWSDLRHQVESGSGRSWEVQPWISFLNEVRELSQSSGVEATHVVGKLGLAYTLAKMVNKDLGFEATSNTQDWEEEVLYQVIFVLEKGIDENAWLKQVTQAKAEKIGHTVREKFKILSEKDAIVIDTDCKSIQNAYESGWEKYFEELA